MDPGVQLGLNAETITTLHERRQSDPIPPHRQAGPLASAGCSLVRAGGAAGVRRVGGAPPRLVAGGCEPIGMGRAFDPLLDVAVYVLVVAVLAELVGLPLELLSGLHARASLRSLHRERRTLVAGSRQGWPAGSCPGRSGGCADLWRADVVAARVVRSWPAPAILCSASGSPDLAPILLLPLFYRFKPLDRTPLRDRLTELAGKAGTPVVGASEWMLSDRTKKANAALAGLGRTRRILLSDTLLARSSDEEIEAILAHELAHHVHRDIWAGLA